MPFLSSEICSLSLGLVGIDSRPKKYRQNFNFSTIFWVKLVNFTERFIARKIEIF